MRLQVYVSDELGERIAAQAEKDRRAVSEWVALFLEDRIMVPTMEITGGSEFARVGSSSTTTAGPKVCLHSNVEKRTTEALGTRRFCADCGTLL